MNVIRKTISSLAGTAMFISPINTSWASEIDPQIELNRKPSAFVLPDISEKLVAAREQIGADITIEKGHTGLGTSVVVMDEGTQRNHIQFKDRIIEEVCTSRVGETDPRLRCRSDRILDIGIGAAEYTKNADGTPYQWADHGTMVSSGVLQFAPDTRIISIKSHGDHLAALEWVIQNAKRFNIAAVNMSFGSLVNERVYSDCSKDPSYSEWTSKFEKLRLLGVVLVAGSGNDGNTNKSLHPACQPLVVGVGAVNINDQIVSYSNISQNIKLLAPTEYEAATVSLDSSKVDSWTGMFGGTSAAAPIVSALFAVGRALAPQATTEQLIQAAIRTGKRVDDKIIRGLSRVQFDQFAEYVLEQRATWSSGGSGTLNDESQSTAVSEVERLQEQLAFSEAELALLRKQISDEKVARTELEGKLASLNNLQLQLSISEANRLELISKLESLKGANADLLKKITLAEANNSVTQQKLIGIQDENVNLQSILTGLRKTILNADELIASLKAANADLQEKLISLQSKYSELEKSFAKNQATTASASQEKTLICVKKNEVLRVSGKTPVCPSGFKKK